MRFLISLAPANCSFESIPSASLDSVVGSHWPELRSRCRPHRRAPETHCCLHSKAVVNQVAHYIPGKLCYEHLGEKVFQSHKQLICVYIGGTLNHMICHVSFLEMAPRNVKIKFAISQNIKHGTTTWSTSSTFRYMFKRIECRDLNRVFIHAYNISCIIAKRWKHPKCPPVNKWINKM